jgi:hypothetical protein
MGSVQAGNGLSEERETMTDKSGTKLAAIAAALRETEPDLVPQIEYWSQNLPDAKTCPASKAVVEAYLERIEALLSYIRAGEEGLRRHFKERPNLVPEIDELKTWLYSGKRPVEAGRELIADRELTVGDWLVSTGMSYSQASEMLHGAKRLKMGAPTSQRQVTLHALDLELSENMSHTELARKLCDCGGAEHGDLCRDRFRKRLDLLKKMMSQYKIRT